ncbi:MAG: TldD/PmbA family protein [Bacillota bacterium]|jgi:TldD protein
MLSKRELEKIINTALAEGAEFADIFLERKVTTNISCEDNKIERVNSGIDAGAGVRVINGETTSYAYTNNLTIDGLIEVANIASRAAKGTKKIRDIAINKRVPEFDFNIKLPPNEVSVEDKVKQVEIANTAARNIDNRIKQVSIGYGDVIQDVVIANSEGVFVEDKRIRTRLNVNVIAVSGEQIQTGYESLGGTQGFEILSKNSAEEVAEKAGKRAVMLLNAQPAPAGKMAVVMAAEAGGTMVHEACGHGLEADLVQKKISVYAGKKGQKVATPNVTVVDDAVLTGKYGSFRFDDEGSRARKKVLIKDGILQEYMYDHLTAKKEQRESTGNGRRESYRDKPIPRMTNTLINPGKDNPAQIIKDTPCGLMVKKMGGGQVNTTNGDFVFDVAEGYLIEDGEVTKPVRGATLTGNGPSVLKMVDRVGNDLGFAIGICGKEGQGVPVSDAQPTMRIKELIVGGRVHSGSKGNQQIRRL